MNIEIRFSELSVLEKDVVFTTDAVIKNLSTDTRSIKKGDTYLAIRGEHHDGHDFIDRAVSSGASSLVVSSAINAAVPSIKVKDTVVSLGNIAKIYRNKLPAKIIGITGSNGKTTVKEMVASICRESGEVTATLSNNNNKIGAPLTLLSASRSDDYVIVEIGTSEQGEIAYLSNIVEPDVSIVTTISESHLAGIGSRDDVFREKSAIIPMTQKTGCVVVNNDCEYASQLREMVNGPSVITYGLKGDADVGGRFQLIDEGLQVTAQSPVGELTYTLSVPGSHNVSNSFAAIAISCALGISNDKIVVGLEKFAGIKGRLQVKQLSSSISLIDDSYNANPASTKAALDVLSDKGGRKIFVFGGMAELGEQEEGLHRMIGDLAVNNKVDMLFVYGATAIPTFDQFAGEKYHFDSLDDLNKSLMAMIKPGDTVLVKASRRFNMDQVGRYLEEELA